MLQLLVLFCVVSLAYSSPASECPGLWREFNKLEQRVNQKLKDYDTAIRYLEKNQKMAVPAVAFTAINTDSLTVSAGGTLTFDFVHINADNGYNANTGVFTCTHTGYYIFSISIMTREKLPCKYDLVKNGVVLAMQYGDGAGGTYASSSTTVSVLCTAGEQVSVRARETCHVDHQTIVGNCQFAGILVNA